MALGMAYSNRRGLHVAGKKIGQSFDVLIQAGTRWRSSHRAARLWAIPWSLRSVECEATQRVAVIEFLHSPMTSLAPEAELVFPDSVGDDVSQMTSRVIAAFRRSDSDLLKPRNGDIRCPENGLAIDRRVGA